MGLELLTLFGQLPLRLRNMAPSKLCVLCDGIIEAGWLVAVAATPLFFNPYSRRGFEADKLLLLRSVAGVMAAAWLIGWIERRRAPRPTRTTRWRSALALPTLALVVTWLLTTLTSMTPRISFFGSYTRLQGTATALACVIVFLLIFQRLRTRQQLDRLVLTTILSSLAVALYGWAQRYSLDPLSWGGRGAADRVSATMGNPIYMAAYLVMAFFLAAGKVVESLGRMGKDGKGTLANLLRASGYACIALVQLGAIVFSGSRGPFLGWLTGLGIFALLLALLARRRDLAFGLIGLGLVALILLALRNTPGSLPTGLREIPYIDRLTHLTVNPGDSAQVRLLIWGGSADLVRPHDPLQFPDGTPDPLNLIRPLVGYGPESMYLVFSQSFPLALASETGYAGDTLVGRSHNETWDSLVTSGLAGLLAYQFFFFSVFLYGLRAIGLADTDRQRNLFVGLWVSLGLVGGLVAILLKRTEYLGVGIPAGTLLALGLYLVIVAARLDAQQQRASWRRGDQVLMVALLAAGLAHYVEIQFSFAVASTRVSLWVFAGMLLVLGSGRFAAGDAPSGPMLPQAFQVSDHSDPDSQSAAWIGGVASWAVNIAVLLSTLLYGFVTNAEQISNPARILWRALTFHPLQGRESYAILAMLLLVWLLSLVLIFSEMERTGTFKSSMDWLGGLALFALLSLGLAAIFGLGVAGQLSVLMRNMTVWQEGVTRHVGLYVGLFDRYVAGLFLLFLMMALVLLAEHKGPSLAWAANRWSLVVLGPVAVIATLWINCFNLDSVRADIVYQRGQVYDMLQEWDFAIPLYKHAIHLAPDEDVYYRGLGYAFMEKAGAANEAVATSISRFDAQSPLDEIWSLDARQTAELNRTDLLYAARAVFARGRAINPLNADHTAGLAQVYQRWAGWTTDPGQRSTLANESSQYYAQAVRLRPRDAKLWNGWATIDLFYQNAPDAATSRLDEAQRLDARLWETHQNLALLYMQKGDLSSAIHEAQMAASLAPADAQSQLSEWVEQLRVRMTVP